MNKQEAAASLGVSVRTLESYVAQNRLSVRYVKGKTRPVADFDAGELERLQNELALALSRSGEAQTSRAPNPATPQTAGAELARAMPQSQPGPVVVIEAAHFQQLLQAVSGANLATAQTPQNLAGKMLLSLAEAQILTGLSRETLKTAISEGHLRARQMGRAWRLRPEDVRDWLRNGFEKNG